MAEKKNGALVRAVIGRMLVDPRQRPSNILYLPSPCDCRLQAIIDDRYTYAVSSVTPTYVEGRRRKTAKLCHRFANRRREQKSKPASLCLWRRRNPTDACAGPHRDLSSSSAPCALGPVARPLLARREE